VHDRLIERIDDEVRTSMGLVDERRYLEQFERYLTQVSCWVKHEKYHNPVTGQDEDADEDLMAEWSMRCTWRRAMGEPRPSGARSSPRLVLGP